MYRLIIDNFTVDGINVNDAREPFQFVMDSWTRRVTFLRQINIAFVSENSILATTD